MPAEAGIQNYLKTLDSRLRGNDAKGHFKTFYETINVGRSMFSLLIFLYHFEIQVFTLRLGVLVAELLPNIVFYGCNMTKVLYIHLQQLSYGQ